MKNGTIAAALAALVPAIAGAQMIVRPWSQTNEALEKRVAADCAGRPAALVHYAVPAMSDLQHLPDVYPEDGKADAPVAGRTAKLLFGPEAGVAPAELKFDVKGCAKLKLPQQSVAVYVLEK